MRSVAYRARALLGATIAMLPLCLGVAHAVEMPDGCCVERVASGQPFAPKPLAVPPKPSLNLNLTLTVTVIVEVRRADRPHMARDQVSNAIAAPDKDRPSSR